MLPAEWAAGGYASSAGMGSGQMLRLPAFTQMLAWESERTALTVAPWRLSAVPWAAAATGICVAEQPAIWQAHDLGSKRILCELQI